MFRRNFDKKWSLLDQEEKDDVGILSRALLSGDIGVSLDFSESRLRFTNAWFLDGELVSDVCDISSFQYVSNNRYLASYLNEILRVKYAQIKAEGCKNEDFLKRFRNRGEDN